MQTPFDTRDLSHAGPSTGDGWELQDMAALVSQLFVRADRDLQAQMLGCLLAPFGPLALASVASGAFGAFVQDRHWRQSGLRMDDVPQFDAEQLQELACFAFQIDPGVLMQLDDLLTSQARRLKPSPAWLRPERALDASAPAPLPWRA